MVLENEGKVIDGIVLMVEVSVLHVFWSAGKAKKAFLPKAFKLFIVIVKVFCSGWNKVRGAVLEEQKKKKVFPPAALRVQLSALKYSVLPQIKCIVLYLC